MDIVGRMGSALIGGRIGIVATLGMSAIMLLAKRAGLSGELPPEAIADAIAEEMPTDEQPSEQDRDTFAVIMHFVFGGLAGVLYGFLAKDVVHPLRGTVLGMVFGSSVYAISYLGWVPALRILPPAHRDRPGRVATMVVAHWVYGALLGALTAVGMSRREPT